MIVHECILNVKHFCIVQCIVCIVNCIVQFFIIPQAHFRLKTSNMIGKVIYAFLTNPGESPIIMALSNNAYAIDIPHQLDTENFQVQQSMKVQFEEKISLPRKDYPCEPGEMHGQEKFHKY